jgi:hypothetical protein
MSFSSHTKLIQDNLNQILTQSIPEIDRSLVFISEEYLFKKFKSENKNEKLYITRGLHFGSENDAFHFNFKIIGYDTEFHVYVGLNFRLESYPFMLLFITDNDYTIPSLYEYLQYNDYDRYLLFNVFNSNNMNDIIKIYENIIKKNQELYKSISEHKE